MGLGMGRRNASVSSHNQRSASPLSRAKRAVALIGSMRGIEDTTQEKPKGHEIL
jgi:hypothetical protein